MELPLFPLNSVLFPGMPIKLHIFEERYKLMINECIDTQTPFGVVLIQSGRDSLGPLAQPYMVGTTAQITEVQKLPFGRMNIVAVGRDRFRINHLDTSSAYLKGDVDLLNYETANRVLMKLGYSQLHPLVMRYLEGLQQAKQVEFDESQIPDSTVELGYLAAILLQMENAKKQELLEIDTTREFLTELIRLYQREVALQDALLNPPTAELNNNTPFSLS